MGIKNDRHKKQKGKDKDTKKEFEKILKIKDKKERKIKKELNKNRQQTIEQIKEERQQFRNNIKEVAIQFDKKIKSHNERANAEQAVMKRQIDYLKAVYKLEEKKQEDERAF